MNNNTQTNIESNVECLLNILTCDTNVAYSGRSRGLKKYLLVFALVPLLCYIDSDQGRREQNQHDNNGPCNSIACNAPLLLYTGGR